VAQGGAQPADTEGVGPVRPRTRPPARLAALVAAALALVAIAAPQVAHAASSFPTVFGPVTGNPANRLLGQPMDQYAYDHARRCRRSPQPGALAMVDWLKRNASGQFWGIMRCSKLGRGNYSLHAEGRAIDWHLNARRAGDRREAARLISLLLAPDAAGNLHALARRMGVQEIIWDCRAWFGGGEVRKYSVCYKGRGGAYKNPGPTLAHRDHIHFGLSRAGAGKQTTFWVSG
jgi:hypothetical protein